MQLAAASKDKVDCMTNLALVAQKERRFTDCFKWCDKALRWDTCPGCTLVSHSTDLLCLPPTSCGQG